MRKLPEDPKPIVNALAALAKRNDDSELLELLEQSDAVLEWYDTDFGVERYQLVLGLPFNMYASLDGKLRLQEEALADHARLATRRYSGETVDRVIFAPNLDAPEDWRSGARPLSVPIQDADRIWKPGHFRLFVSHVSAHKLEMTELRDRMAKRYVSAFVAHEDIEPCREWQDEIRLALGSCHAMLAYITPEFHDSIWCMQEVGWALGRGILLIPVKAPDDPKGFMGIGQAMRVPEGDAYKLRDAVIDLLWKNDRTHRQMHEPAVLAVEKAPSKGVAKIASQFIIGAKGLSEEHAKRLLATTSSNAHVIAQPRVTADIRKLASSVGIQPPVRQDDSDEYDPFADS